MDDRSASSFVKDSITTFVARITQAVLTVVTSIIIARTLGPTGKGRYVFLILVASVSAMLFNFGIGIANTYYTGKKKYPLDNILSNTIFLSAFLGISLIIALQLTYGLLSTTFFNGISRLQFSIITYAVPFYLFLLYISSIFLGLNRIKTYNLLLLIQGMVVLILVSMFASIKKLTTNSAILFWASGIFVASLMAFFLIKREAKFKHAFDFQLFKDSLSFGFKGYIANLATFLNYRLDMFIIKIFLTITSIGIYSVAVGIGEMLWQLASAVGIVLFPRVASGSSADANRFTPSVCRHTLFITIIGAIIMLGVGRYFILVFYGKAFLPAFKPLMLLLPGIVAMSLAKVISSDLMGRGKPIYATKISLITLLFTTGLDLILIPRYGIDGAAAASSIVYVGVAVLSLIWVRRESHRALSDFIFIRGRDLQKYATFLKR